MFGVRVRLSFWFAAALCIMLITDSSGAAAQAVGSACLHEAGHLLAFSKQARSITAITLAPYGMKITVAPASHLSYTKEIQAALCGPLVNLVLFLLSATANLLFQNSKVEMFSGVNAGLFVFNMLPVGPLDGGRILYCLAALAKDEEVANELLKFTGHGFAVLLAVIYIFSTTNGASNTTQLICLFFVISLAFFKT